MSDLTPPGQLQLTPGTPGSASLQTVTQGLLVPVQTDQRFRHFPPETYDLTPHSNLVRFLRVLLGDSGAGQLRKRLVLSRLGQAMSSSYFYDLDSFYGALFNLNRTPAEQLPMDPYTDTVPNSEWRSAAQLDASYRQRLFQFGRAIAYGPTPTGMRLVAEAILSVTCDIYESFVYAAYTGQTYLNLQSYTYAQLQAFTYAQLEGTTGGTPNALLMKQFIISPHRPCTPSEIYNVLEVIDQLKPADAIAQVIPQGPQVYAPVAVAGVWADSNYWEIEPAVTVISTGAAAPYGAVTPGTTIAPNVPPFNSYQGEQWFYNKDMVGALSYLQDPAQNVLASTDAQRIVWSDGTYTDYLPTNAPLPWWVALLGRYSQDGVMAINALSGRGNVTVNSPVSLSELTFDGIDVNALLSALAQQNVNNLQLSTDSFSFWATDNRAQDDGSRDILEVRFGSANNVNAVALDVAHFPQHVSVEYYDDPSGTWISMLQHDVTDSIPTVLNSSDDYLFAKTHPQHYGPNHWLSLATKILPVATQRIRVVLTRGPGVAPIYSFATTQPAAGGGWGTRTVDVAYSLAVRRLKVGFSIEGPDDLPTPNLPATEVIGVGSDIMGSPVAYSLYMEAPANAISTNPVQWRCGPQPTASAVVNFYLDVRTPVGAAQVVDRFYIDPTHLGVHATLYWSNSTPIAKLTHTAQDTPLIYPASQITGNIINTSAETNTPAGLQFPSATGTTGYIDVPNWGLQWTPFSDFWVGLSFVATLAPTSGLMPLIDLLGMEIAYQNGGFMVIPHDGSEAFSLAAPMPLGAVVDLLVGYVNGQGWTIAYQFNNAAPVTQVFPQALGISLGLIDNGHSTTLWTVQTGTGFAASSVQGNPTPSYVVPANNVVWRSIGPQSVYAFDVWVPTGGLADFFFGCSASGAGYMARVDVRAGQPSGIATTTSWAAVGTPTGITGITANAWHHVVITVQGTAAVLMTVDGLAAYNGNLSGALGPMGSYIGLNGETISTNYFDNIQIAASKYPNIRIGGFNDNSQPATSGMLLQNLVLKNETLTAATIAGFMADPEPYCSKGEFASQDQGLTVNAYLRFDMSFVSTANPSGMVGGQPTFYPDLFWTPVAGDFLLTTGYLKVPPTLAKFWKIEMTNLAPEPYEGFLPTQATTQTFSATTVAASTTTASVPGYQGTMDPGTATLVALGQGQNPWPLTGTGGAPLDATASSLQMSPTQVMVSNDPGTAQQIGAASWLYNFTNVRQGMAAARFANPSYHSYQVSDVAYTAKVAFFCGFQEIQAIRTSTLAQNDTDVYYEYFLDDMFIESNTFQQNPGDLFTSTNPSLATSLPNVAQSVSFISTHGVTSLQFATVQSDAVQAVLDDDMRNQALNSTSWIDITTWHAVGDVTPLQVTYLAAANSIVFSRQSDSPEAAQTAGGAVHGLMNPPIEPPLETFGTYTLQNVLSAEDSSFEGGTVGDWGTGAINATVANSTAQAQVGTHSLAVTSVAAGSMSVHMPHSVVRISITPAQTYTMHASFRPATTARTVACYIQWIDGNGNNLGSPVFTNFTETAGQWTSTLTTATAPAGAVTVDLIFYIYFTGAAGEVHYVDNVSFIGPVSISTGSLAHLTYGGICSAPLLLSVRGRAWVAVRYTVLSGLTQPLYVQLIDTLTGRLVWQAETNGTQGSITEFTAVYDIGSVPNQNVADSLYVQLVQNGKTNDVIQVDTLSVFDESIVWEFSVDGGTTFWQALDTRNNPNGIVRFPIAAQQLVWRCTCYRPAMHVSALQIRPVYQGQLNVDAKPFMAGPNLSVFDTTPNVYDDPMFNQWNNPVPRWWFIAFKQYPNLFPDGVPIVNSFSNFYNRTTLDDISGTITDSALATKTANPSAFEFFGTNYPLGDSATWTNGYFTRIVNDDLSGSFGDSVSFFVTTPAHFDNIISPDITKPIT
jgi:hypothetical protein